MRTEEIKRVRIDYDKLDTILAKNRITKKELAERIGRGATYFNDLKRRNSKVPVGVEKFICEEIGVEPGTLVADEKKEQDIRTDGYVLVMQNLYRSIEESKKQNEKLTKDVFQAKTELRGISKNTMECTEMLEKIWNKLTAQSEQIARIRDELKGIAMSDREKAEEFLKNVLIAEKALENDIIRESMKKGINQADLNAVKRDLDVQVVTTGYGKQQKRW